MYKCCYNCNGGMLAAVPNNKTNFNANYYDRIIELNKNKRFCGINYRDDGHAKDAFKQRYCKNFEVKRPYKGDIITKKKAIELSEIKTEKVNWELDVKGHTQTNNYNKYCFVQDYDSHWYCIPVEQKKNFEEWLTKIYNGEDFEENFEGYRLNMHVSNYSFENFEEIN